MIYDSSPRNPLVWIVMLMVLVGALILTPTFLVAQEHDYEDPEAIKAVLTFENGTLTARADIEWGTYTYTIDGKRLSQGALTFLIYHQDTRTSEWFLCRNFWSIYAAFYDHVQPACRFTFTEAHQSKTSLDEPRMIFTYTGPGQLPTGPFSLFAYSLFYTDPAPVTSFAYERYVGILTCTPAGAKTVCTTSLLPDLEPGTEPPKDPPKDPPKPPVPVSPTATGWSDASYGCGTFGC